MGACASTNTADATQQQNNTTENGDTKISKNSSSSPEQFPNAKKGKGRSGCSSDSDGKDSDNDRRVGNDENDDNTSGTSEEPRIPVNQKQERKQRNNVTEIATLTPMNAELKWEAPPPSGLEQSPSSTYYDHYTIPSEVPNSSGLIDITMSTITSPTTSYHKDDKIDDQMYKAYMKAKKKHKGNLTFQQFIRDRNAKSMSTFDDDHEVDQKYTIPTSLSRVQPLSATTLELDDSFVSSKFSNRKIPASAMTLEGTLQSRSTNDVNEPPPITPSAINPFKLAAHLGIDTTQEEEEAYANDTRNMYSTGHRQILTRIPETSGHERGSAMASTGTNHSPASNPRSNTQDDMAAINGTSTHKKGTTTAASQKTPPEESHDTPPSKRSVLEGTFAGMEFEALKLSASAISPLTVNPATNPNNRTGTLLEVSQDDLPLISPLTIRGFGDDAEMVAGKPKLRVPESKRSKLKRDSAPSDLKGVGTSNHTESTKSRKKSKKSKTTTTTSAKTKSKTKTTTQRSDENNNNAAMDQDGEKPLKTRSTHEKETRKKSSKKNGTMVDSTKKTRTSSALTRGGPSEHDRIPSSSMRSHSQAYDGDMTKIPRSSYHSSADTSSRGAKGKRSSTISSNMNKKGDKKKKKKEKRNSEKDEEQPHLSPGRRSATDDDESGMSPMVSADSNQALSDSAGDQQSPGKEGSYSRRTPRRIKYEARGGASRNSANNSKENDNSNDNDDDDDEDDVSLVSERSDFLSKMSSIRERLYNASMDLSRRDSDPNGLEREPNGEKLSKFAERIKAPPTTEKAKKPKRSNSPAKGRENGEEGRERKVTRKIRRTPMSEEREVKIKGESGHESVRKKKSKSSSKTGKSTKGKSKT